MKSHLIQLAFGVAFGVVLSLGGFSDWHQVHGMFRLRELGPPLAFATALAITTPLWLWLKRYAARSLRPRVNCR